MTVRTRLTLWYAGMLLGSFLLMGAVLHYELVVEDQPGYPRESANEKIADVLLFYGLPTLLLIVGGGSWFILRLLKPVATLTAAAERVHAKNLGERIASTGRSDEFDRLAGVFNGMLARVEAGTASVRDFTLHASHELKTPLTILSVQAEAALGEAAPAHALREVLQSQLEEVRRLSALVDALGFLAKADAGLPLVAPENLRLDELLRVAVAHAQLIAAKSGIAIKLNLSEPVTLNGDPASLRQMLLNLLSNAVKYNEPGGWVRIELLASPEQFILTIENSGLPIPPELLLKIFDRFVRGSSVCEGSGLGLSISKTIAEAHRGSITVIAREGGGAIVSVNLPRLAFVPPRRPVPGAGNRNVSVG